MRSGTARWFTTTNGGSRAAIGATVTRVALSTRSTDTSTKTGGAALRPGCGRTTTGNVSTAPIGTSSGTWSRTVSVSARASASGCTRCSDATACGATVRAAPRP